MWLFDLVRYEEALWMMLVPTLQFRREAEKNFPTHATAQAFPRLDLAERSKLSVMLFNCPASVEVLLHRLDRYRPEDLR